MNCRSFVFVLVWLAASPLLRAGEPRAVVQPGSVPNPRQPQAAVDSKGTVYIAFGSGDSVYCAVSTDGGESYGDAVLVGKVGRLALRLRRGPRIAAGSGTVVITAIDGGSLLSWRSNDKGETWQGPAQVNDAQPHAREGLHAMAMGPKGEVCCVWLDDRDEGKQVFGSVSTNGGESWSRNFLVYRSPSGSVCECCHPAVTYDANGGLHVMWRNSLEGFRDPWVAVSRDGGRTFSAGAKLGTGGWKLNACPMDGGYLATTAPGKVTTVWRRAENIFRTDTSRNGEQLLGKGEQPWVAATGKGAYLVWLSPRNGDLWLATPTSGEPRKIASGATDPMVAASPAGEGPVVVVWESGGKRATSIMATGISE